MHLRLLILDVDRAASYPLDQDVVSVGSGEDCDVRLGHPAVSRLHARLVQEDSEILLEDMGSSNGTFLDGRRVSGWVRLKVPAALSFGPVTARLEALDPEDLEPAVVLGNAESGEPKSPGRTATTIQSAAIQRLVTEMLPRWMDALESKDDLVALAQRVGASLVATLPIVSILITRQGVGQPRDEKRGLIYRAGAGSLEGSMAEEAPEATVVVEGREICCTVRFPHPLQARAYRSVIKSAARFIELAQPSHGPQRPVLRPLPALPEPATVVPDVRSIYEQAAKIAEGDISVLITGESGTGKEVLARFLHDASPRREKPFVALNCAALAKDLLESELFGIEEGVATGVRSRPGCFERAAGGTLFLDEIGDMAAETQASILRVLQEGEVYRLGGREPRSADVRVLAATNRDVDALLAQQELRADLYHRIADWRVEIPPLRERPQDITNLAAHFLATSAGKRGLVPIGLSKRAARLLERYDWPGNIRQLEREIARAALFLAPGELLQGHHLQEDIQRGPVSQEPEARTLKERLEAAEREILEQEIRRQNGNVRRAAEVLDVGRSTLYRRIRELGLDLDD